MRKSAPEMPLASSEQAAAFCRAIGIDYDLRGRGYRHPIVRLERGRLRYPFPTWREPPRIKRCVTQDATSLIYVPANSTEWSGFASGVAVPDALWLCQEASGNLADSIGSFTLTKNGSPTYANAETGWSRKSVRVHLDNASDYFLSLSASLPDLSTTSCTCYQVWSPYASSPNAQRKIQLMGNAATSIQWLVSSASPSLNQLYDGGQVALGTANQAGHAVMPVTLKFDATLTKATLYTQQEMITGTSTGRSGKEFTLLGSTANAPACGTLYACMWKGTNAEMSDITVKGLWVALGWTNILWYVSFTAALSDSVAVSDRLDVALTDPVSLTESDSTAESVAAVLADVVALADSEGEGESLGIVAASVVGVSEAEATAEALSAVLAAKPSLAESETTTGSVAATVSFVVALADALTTIESLATVAQSNIGIDETLDTDNEILTVVLNAVALVAEAESLAESIATVFQRGVLLDDGLVVAESIIATFVQVIMAVASYAHVEEFERWISDCIAVENDSRCEAGPASAALPFDTRTWAQAMIETTSLDVRLVE